jgi:GNAT superfamily N-acetyltransferase
MTMPDAAFEFVTSDVDDPDVRASIVKPLRAFNQQAIGQPASIPLCVAVKGEQGEIVGGLWGHTALGWLYVELLVVPESSRRSGLGTQLMRIAEAEAIQRGCHSSWLDTFEFQAKGFYEKLGYTEFGRLENFPTGYARHYLQKQLQGAR